MKATPELVGAVNAIVRRAVNRRPDIYAPLHTDDVESLLEAMVHHDPIKRLLFAAAAARGCLSGRIKMGLHAPTELDVFDELTRSLDEFPDKIGGA